MEKVIFDCDNTFSVPGKDVDDGLALLYLLGSEVIDLIGVTTTFGNSTIDTVHETSKQMFLDLRLDHLSLLKGAGTPNEKQSEAAKFLVEEAAKHPGEISLLATGSLTNLYQASKIDSDFFRNLKQIVLMGGITEPLYINENRLNELNFSSDPKASLQVLQSEAEVTILTGNICLQALFGEKHLSWLKQYQQEKIYKYILDNLLPWIKRNNQQFGVEGFYNWDTIAAVFLTHPELFEDSQCHVISTEDDLKSGFLRKIDSPREGYSVHITEKIKDIEALNSVILKTWGKVHIPG